MQKKLKRSNKDKKVCGVCGGIAEYFDIDVSLVRLICMVLVLSFGTGLLAYFLAALIIPKDED